MNDSPEPPAPSLSLDVYWPMMKSAALIAAGQLGVFAALARGPLRVEDLAERLGASVEGTDRLVAVLVQTGYVERTADGGVANGAFARAWLTGATGPDLNTGLRWFGHAWEWLSGLGEAVLEGGPRTVLWERMRTRPGLGAAFASFMHDHAATVVADVQGAVELPAGARSLLDVGGSHGLHAAAFCRRYPELEAVVFDLPVSLAGTPARLVEWGLEARIRCLEGDIVRDALPGPFDVVTYFLVAHNQTDEDNARIVRKMAQALAPGGWLFVHEYVRETGGARPVNATEALAAAFDLTLLVETGTRTHTAERILAWLGEAGLEDLERTDLRPIEKGSVFRARKPS
jgi:SAM-dependent methyltransferase